MYIMYKIHYLLYAYKDVCNIKTYSEFFLSFYTDTVFKSYPTNFENSKFLNCCRLCVHHLTDVETSNCDLDLS